MKIYIAIISVSVALCTFSYFLGKSRAKIEVITEQIEVIKYVEKKRAEIHSRPNAKRDTLLERMHNGML